MIDETDALFFLVQHWLKASTPQTIRHVFLQHQTELLSQQCSHLLRSELDATERQGGAHAGRRIVKIRLHLQWLSLIREHGIDAAWKRLQRDFCMVASSSPDVDLSILSTCIDTYLTSPSWADAYRFLTYHQRLLATPLAIAAISARIDQLDAALTAAKTVLANVYRLYIRLIEAVAQLGPDTGFETFLESLHRLV